MPSQVDIANLALFKIGKKAILTLDDASDEARVCKLMYQTVLEGVLRSHKWRFAMKQAGPLAADVEAPTWRYQYRYPLPPDCLRVVRVNADEDGNSWEIQGQSILTDQVTPYIEYIYRVTNTALFDALFVQAFVEALATEIAIPLTNTPTLVSLSSQAYAAKIQEARTTDGMGASPEEYSMNILNDVRI